MPNQIDIFKGVSFPFRFNSRGGVATSVLTPYDYSRIKESLVHIITTRKQEFPMRPEMGTVADMYVFDDLTDETTLGLLQYTLKEEIERQDDRVRLKGLDAYAEEDGRVTINVTVLITKFQVTETVSVTVEQ